MPQRQAFSDRQWYSIVLCFSGLALSFMQKFTRHLALCIPLSYLLVLVYQSVVHHTVYHQPVYLQLALMALGISYLTRFVLSPTMQSVIFAVQLVVLFRLCAWWLYGWPLTDRVVGGLNLAYFICYLLCIHQLVQLRRTRNTPTD